MGCEVADYGSTDPIYANTAVHVAEEFLKTYLSLEFDPNSSSAPKVQAFHDYDMNRK